uniref:7TM_GPCR_Srx domain-containing protein n=1 Tax=Caenorhabditis tropicalis TaxID=1561998 RepID=A0A1I7U2E3_9PELO
MNNSSMMSEDFPLPGLATFILLTVSLFGFLLNIYLMTKFILRKGRWSGFQKLCLVKTIPNIIVCASFLFWVVPLSLIRSSQVARLPNVIIGQIAGVGAYIMGPLIQLCMSINRCLVLYFPFKQSLVDKKSLTTLAVAIAVIIAFTYTVLGIQGI